MTSALPRITLCFGNGSRRGRKHSGVTLSNPAKERWTARAGGRKSTLVDTGGERFVLSIVRDITERKRAEEGRLGTEEKYRALYESSRDAIMMLAPPKWEFTAGNPAAIALFGARDEREFVAAAAWSLSPEYQPDGELSSVKARQMIEAAMESGSYSFEWTHKKFNGEEFFATVILTRMIYRGQPLLQATVRNITDLKRAEAEMTERLHLATLVAEVGRWLLGLRACVKAYSNARRS